jgi:hypothetical protein
MRPLSSVRSSVRSVRWKESPSALTSRCRAREMPNGATDEDVIDADASENEPVTALTFAP